MNVLFIDGPHAGKVVGMWPDREWWEIPNIPRIPISYYPRPLMSPVLTSTLYKIHEVRMRCGGHDDFIIHVGMLPDNNTQPAMAYFRYSADRLL